MLNLHCNKNGKTKKKKKKKKKTNRIKKKNKKICNYRDSNPQNMGSKSTEVSTTLCRPMELTDKNNLYMPEEYQETNAV